MPTPKQHTDNAARQRAYRQRQQKALTQEQQRKGLPPAPTIPTMPGTARWKAMITAAYNLLNNAQTEMQAYYDDRSEQWQEGDKGETFQSRLDSIQAAIDTIEEANALH